MDPEIIIIGIVLGVGIFADSLRDVLRFRITDSLFENHWWCDPRISWRNKYKNGDPTQDRAFIGSTTWLSWLTDFWHFNKMVTTMCYQFIISFLLFDQALHILLGVMVMSMIRGFIFEMTFRQFK
jgi:hypothetical protein